MRTWFQTALNRWKQWVARGHFFAGAFLPAFLVFTMLFHGGLRDLDILLHKARAVATVTESSSIPPGRSKTYYRYEVNGRSYSGGGVPDPDTNPTPIEERKPISVGSTYEIWYSTAHPSFSTPRTPGILLGQLFVASLILLGVDYMASRRRQKAG